MTAVLRTPHKLYKQYQSWVENAITALGLALLVTLVLASLPVYPPNWAPVLITVVFLVGLRWSAAAYVAAVATVLYPIYTVSLYLAILFIAITILGQRPFSHYLGATILVLATPTLAAYHLHWLVPIMAGLWWGSVNGFWIGGAAALWGKILGGMAGLDIDWLMMAGDSPAAAGIMQRYHELDPLETLLKILAPFAPNPTFLLYHLLQIAIWAMVAALLGALAAQKWVHYRYTWSTLLLTASGAVLLAISHLLLATWLSEAAPLTINYNYLLVATVFSLIVAGSLEVTRRFLDLPLAPKAQSKRRLISVPVSRRESQEQTHSQTQTPVPVSVTQKIEPQPKLPTPVKLPDLPEWEPPDEDNNLILIELD